LTIDQKSAYKRSCNNNNATTGTTTTTIRWLDQVLAYAVHLAEDDDDDDDTVDWSIQPWPSIDDDDHYKVLIITLHKATPMANVHVWWQRLFVNELARDESHDPIARHQQQAQFKTMWEQAHEHFVRILSTRTTIMFNNHRPIRTEGD
jgi:hypothetical protein